MKKLKLVSALAALSMLASVFVGCGGGPDDSGTSGPVAQKVTKEFTQPDLELDSSKIQGGWAYVTYSLDDYAGKDVTIDFSCEMKVENAGTNTQKLQWQVNNGGSYPTVVAHDFAPTEKDFVTISGKNETPITVASGALLYLSTYQLDTADLKITVKNIKYTVSYGSNGTEEPEPEPEVITYPTDIFTIGEAGSCGITLRDTKEAFTIFETGSVASPITTNSDGSVTWVATAAGGGGGGVAFYAKSTKEEINIANYKSIDIELVYSPITGKWNPKAKKPGFCMRILPWDSTGMFGGYEDLEYFDAEEDFGTLTKTIEIPDDFANKVIASSDFDFILGFAIKFNDYNRGNTNGDQLKVQLKNVKFNPKENAAEDKKFDDGLDVADYGTVQSVEYKTKDWAEYKAKETAISNAKDALAKAKTEEETAAAQKKLDEANAIELSTSWTEGYKKHAWVYLPAGYDATDTTTKYPLFILLHGHGQNENTWGLSNNGNGGKIKGYMDRGMKSGEVKKFILVCVTGIASKNWGPNGAGTDIDGFNAFGGELRNDLIPFMRENYNIAEGRDNVAIAGLSMGGGQTFNIGIGECLDLISNFAGFSGALFSTAEEFTAKVDGTAAFDGLKIHNLYMTCGTSDGLVYSSYPSYVEAMKAWDRVENFVEYTYPNGGHDFPVWFKGFSDFIKIVFQEGKQLY